jgi:hypothetical protein
MTVTGALWRLVRRQQARAGAIRWQRNSACAATTSLFRNIRTAPPETAGEYKVVLDEMIAAMNSRADASGQVSPAPRGVN